MANDFIVTRAELETVMGEMVANIKDIMEAFNAIKKAHNALTEIVGLNRFVIQSYIPQDRLEAATKEYKAQREAMIAAEAGDPSGAN